MIFCLALRLCVCHAENQLFFCLMLQKYIFLFFVFSEDHQLCLCILRRTSTCLCVCKRTSTCLCVCRITSTCICVLEEHRLVSVSVFAEREFESGVSLYIRSISLSANSNATVLLANWTLPAGWEAMQMDVNSIPHICHRHHRHVCVKKNYPLSGWQKLRGSTGGTRRKVWTRTKILSPNIRYFVAN